MPLVKPGDDLVSMILKASEQVGGLRDGDIVVVASSALATAQGRLKELARVRPSKRAKQLAKRSRLEPEFVELVLREASEVLGVARYALLTLREGMLCINAGVDHSNAPPGQVVLMPSKPDLAAEEMMRKLRQRSGARVGVIIADSQVQPLRLGTIGKAIGVAGIEPVIDCRGQLDLFGRRLKITFRAIADQIASAAQVVMGEAAERVPVVIVRDAGLEIVDKPRSSPKISPKRCVYARCLGLSRSSKKKK